TFLQNTENPADILQHLHDKKQRVAAYAFNNDGKKAAIQEIEYLRDSAQQQAEAYGNLAIYADHLLTGLICTASLGFHEATPEQRIVIAHAGEVIEEIAKKAYCTPLSDSLATVKRLLGELNTEIMYEHGALHREAARHDINNVAGHAK